MSILDSKVIQEMAEAFLATAAIGKYEHLKSVILDRFTDSADR